MSTRMPPLISAAVNNDPKGPGLHILLGGKSQPTTHTNSCPSRLAHPRLQALGTTSQPASQLLQPKSCPKLGPGLVVSPPPQPLLPHALRLQALCNEHLGCFSTVILQQCTGSEKWLPTGQKPCELG